MNRLGMLHTRDAKKRANVVANGPSFTGMVPSHLRRETVVVGMDHRLEYTGRPNEA